ncbi:DEAD/DEAH box helicase family protein [Luethyella okanaganae]|uniref:DEAD/DEAH box helicase family protein n=1 Tax=Luethyella okanaganae TaxID=69372 RepID=A0ABW1VAJ4_9MICO
MTLGFEVFPLAENLYKKFADDIPAIEAGAPNRFLQQVTPITASLLKHWFQTDYVDTRGPNFHVGQRDAILSIVYAHEVLATASLQELYAAVAPHAMLDGDVLNEVTLGRNRYPKYAAKMATGTGKTWVLNALLLWQYLNRSADPNDERFTSNFLIVAPGLIVYDRLLDSFLGKLRDETRDFETSDIYAQRTLFVPETYRSQVFGFLQSSVITKHDIGRKVTGSGMVAITNWHLLAGKEDPDFIDDDERSGTKIGAKELARRALPLSPGITTGNALDALDRRYLRGRPLESLKDLPDLLVFNDEAHHVHAIKKGEQTSEVEWQRSLIEIASTKGRRFTQIDFSATPYNETGSGRKRGKRYFPHIVVDFDMRSAMKHGLVKALALDKRKEVAALPLDFASERDEQLRVVGLSNGQRVMLRAGLKKLEILEEQFSKAGPDKHPKLLVVCEDTNVTPYVEGFLREQGYSDEDFLRVDSGKKAELGQQEWEPVRELLFDIDRHRQPKVVICVLMLREGFDVDNICVIVPLRSSQASILLEQTIGRGLRLMWRGDEAIEELKAETRSRITRRQEPRNYFDVLFVIEHPAFEAFYDELLGGELVGRVGDDGDGTRATGDLETVGLREGFEAYDFEIPFVLREADEELTAPLIDPLALPVSKYPLHDLLQIIGNGDRFSSIDAQTKTQFGDYRVDGGVMTATGYNDFLSRITTRIAEAHARAFVATSKQYNTISHFPMLLAYKPMILGWLDTYIRRRLFGCEFDPALGENWRVLLIDDVAQDMAGAVGSLLVEMQANTPIVVAEVMYRRVSEVSEITVRSTAGVDALKCVYPRLPIPSRGGGLERLFIEWADSDTHIEAFVKLHEYQHDFLRRPYLKADGMPAQYSPDFLVRTRHEIFVVETKAQSALSDENVARKKRSALAWVDQLNDLAPEQRGDREWNYVLLGETAVRSWHDKGARVSELLYNARLTAALPSAPTTLI